MSTLFYAPGDGPLAPLGSRPPPVYERHRGGSYFADEGLVAAANVAILLGQPLLLTGDPGVGKTQFAHALARRLGLGEALECLVKSTTTAADLFYSIDELGRFRDAQASRARPLHEYVSFHGLGQAILRAGGPGCALRPMPGRTPPLGERPATFAQLCPQAFGPSDAPRASVVLVDELDKAPRDTPNDMLSEIERMGFDVPELGLRVEAPDAAGTRPIVVITSNSEKSLPDPFLRRCVYYDVPFPDEKLLPMIALAQATWLQGRDGLLKEVLELFQRLRGRALLRRPPGTGELLAWLDLLEPLAHHSETTLRRRLVASLTGDQALLKGCLAVLVKKAEDGEAATQAIRGWIAGEAG